MQALNQEFNTLQKNYYQSARYQAYGVIGISFVVLLGWIFDLDLLKQVIPETVSMNPLTAVLFILSGSSLILVSDSKEQLNRIGKLVASLILIIVLIKLAEYVFNFQEGIDSYLFGEDLQEDNNLYLSNRMASNTALCFLMMAINLFLYKVKGPLMLWIYQILSFGIMALSLLSFIGYLYVVDLFYSLLVKIPMAVHTAFCFLLLGVALLLSRPKMGITAQISSENVGGKVARRIVPMVVIVPVFVGALILQFQIEEIYGLDFGMAILTLSIIVFFLIISLTVVSRLNKTDRARQKAENDLWSTVEDLESRTSELTKSNKELETFSYTLSHDLKSPLRAINSYAKIIQNDYHDNLDEDGRKMLATIARNGAEMGNLIESLLNLAHLGKQGLASKPINMHRLAQEVTETLKISMQSKINVYIESLPPAIGDEVLIGKVFENLISNALKYSSKESNAMVSIGFKTQENKNVYFVKDNGAGFDMKHYDKLFLIFHRLHTQDEFKGTGIGLAIARKIVGFHKGEIWAEALIGKGATFYFSLKGVE
ncbi:ATP-binding protein [Pseudozobellia sp. WGM2]|uniref:sensor histidine kinase n=1 Tax=Pseudozobellia sp. WGM2 TaxID=2787625 RepID=UPI001AE014EA|nr:ATP-binding protein [Pseudozobellia sp. WGM2]